ncbi:unnamed protein product [Urochloa humidicola]
MAYAARLVAKIQPAASLAGMPRSEPRRASSLRIGTLSGSTTVQQQKFVVKSAISVVEGGDAFVGVKQNTSPIIVIDNYDSFTYNLCQVKAIFCHINDGGTFSKHYGNFKYN